LSKFLLQACKVMVGTTDLSDHAFNIDTPATREQVDVSGFSAATPPNREFLPGLADESIVVQFENDFAASSVHATLEPLYRTGASTLVYVAPRQRGTRGRGPAGRRRPNLGNLLMDRAMQPALERHEHEITARFENLLDHVADNFNHG